MSNQILSVGFAIALFWSTAIVLAQEQAPAPSFKDGDTWQFNITRKGQYLTSEGGASEHTKASRTFAIRRKCGLALF